MPDFTLSTNMSLPLPIVGVDPGPDYGTHQNTALSIVDSHDHSAGKGVPVTPDGINISADLPFSGNNATLLRSARFSVQPSPLALPADLGCVYVSGVDLYFNDVNGNQVRITQSGGVAGSPGSIANLTSPASAEYVAANETFVWESDANTAANMDFGSIKIREVLAGANAITISSPAALAANYSLILPAALALTPGFLTFDTGGAGSITTVDNSTLELSGGVIREKDAGTTRAKLAAATVTRATSSGTYSATGLGPNLITNQTLASFVTTGRPVYVWLAPASSTARITTDAATYFGYVRILRDATVIAVKAFQGLATAGMIHDVSIFVVDNPPAGTYTYTATLEISALQTTTVRDVQLSAQEQY